MIIALFPNASKSNAAAVAKEVYQFFQNKGITVVVDTQEARSMGARSLNEIEMSQIDFAVSLGGDGTILRLVHKYPELQAPIIGINLGSLGFMADIPLNDLHASLEQFLQGHYRIENRMMVEGALSGQSGFFALNEVVVHRYRNPSLIELAVYVDGTYLNTFEADGLIISTASGSTAYSLAAGGPILTPELQAFVLTPISPHTISNRPIVFMPKKEIQVQYSSKYGPVEVTFDGIPRFNLEATQTFTIWPSTRVFRLVSLLHSDYFSILRTKLGWAGKLKSVSHASGSK